MGTRYLAARPRAKCMGCGRPTIFAFCDDCTTPFHPTPDQPKPRASAVRWNGRALTGTFAGVAGTTKANAEEFLE